MSEYIEREEIPIIRESDYYLSVKTKHFYFDVYKSWNSSDRKQAMFRAGAYVIIRGRNYSIDCGLFAEWDYKDKQTAFENAKKWVFDYMKQLRGELSMNPTADAQEVRHGEWLEDDYGYCHCSNCRYEHDSPECITPYCPECGAKMDKE